MSKGWSLKISLFLFLLFSHSLGFSAQATKMLKVGVTDSNPFSFLENANGKEIYNGIAIQMWEFIAARHHLQYKYYPASKYIEKAIDQVAKGSFDVLIGDISTTASRRNKVLFSRPYFINYLGLLTKARSLTLSEVIQLYLTPKFMGLILGVIAFIIFLSTLYWLIERKKNVSINVKYLPALRDLLWKLTYHAFRGDKLYMATTIGGKILYLIWILSLFVFFLYFNATIISDLTAARIHESTDFKSVKDLKHETLAAIEGRLGYNIAKRIAEKVIPVKNFQEGINLVKNNKAAAFLDDYILLKESLHAGKYENSNLFISSLSVQYDEYAFAMRLNLSPKIVGDIDEGILELQDTGKTLHICRQFLEASDAKYCIL